MPFEIFFMRCITSQSLEKMPVCSLKDTSPPLVNSSSITPPPLPQIRQHKTWDIAVFTRISRNMPEYYEISLKYAGTFKIRRKHIKLYDKTSLQRFLSTVAQSK